MKEEKVELIKRMRKLRKLIPATIEAVQSLPEVDDVDLYESLPPGILRLELEYDIPKYKSLRKALRNNWQYTKKHFNEFMGAYFVYFQHKVFNNVSLSIVLKLHTDNLVKIGEIVEPIYEKVV